MTNQRGLPGYDDPAHFPERVWRAVELTRANDFPQACLPEVGRLLQLFAGIRGVERICELGTAYGVGAAWIESGMRPGATFLTVELDPGRAAASAASLADNPAIEVVSGDWTVALDRGQFDLLFSDGGPKRNPGDPEKLAPLVRPGGLLVLDDYTPGFGADPSRRIWLENPAYRTVELTLTPTAAALIATKR